MIRTLFIQNYALIESLDITFEDGFSVITGETGAGKSIMLGALALLLGQRADSKAIRQGASKCVIEAHFDVKDYHFQSFFQTIDVDYDDDCILRREMYASGKSRAFINDTPVQLSQLKAVGDKLIDIHSQHQNLMLNDEGFQLDVLDILSHHKEQLSDYRSIYRSWTDTKKAMNKLVEEAERNKADEDYVRFQLTQLQEARLQADEQEQLEQDQDILSDAEDIKSVLYHSYHLLDGDEQGLLQSLKDCHSSLASISKFFPSADELAERLNSSYIELKDIAEELTAQEESVEFNPTRLDEVTNRLNTIYTLQKKHHVNTVAELMTIEAGYQKQLDSIMSFDDQIAALRLRCQQEQQELIKEAGVLTNNRKQAAKEVEARMQSRLAALGMPNAHFKVEVDARKEPDMNGMDSVKFLFCANKNGVLQDISSVASGGEIARVMLSLKAMLAGETRLSTIIFDEIDTGVSGEVASRMADMMQDMANGNSNEMHQAGRQVISITHLPQIAAKGSVHYKVYKKDNELETVSHIRRLTTDERVEEIAQMLSGDTLSEAAIQNARVLLKI